MRGWWMLFGIVCSRVLKLIVHELCMTYTTVVAVHVIVVVVVLATSVAKLKISLLSIDGPVNIFGITVLLT